MNERFDVIVLGAGPGGEVVVFRLAPKGLRVALVEAELIGGECAYWACVPSKTLLRPPEIADEGRRGYGTGPSAIDWQAVREYRDYMTRDWNDAKQVAEYGEMGVTVVKAAGRLAGPGVVEAGGRRLEAPHIVVGTGSVPAIPPVDGLAETGYWTSREATALKAVPASAVVLGGGPVGVELGQMMASYGAYVTIVEHGRVLGREDPEVSRLLVEALQARGIDVRTGVSLSSVARKDGKIVASLSDGQAVAGDQLLVASGRRPRVRDIGLESVGLGGKDRLSVDEHGRVIGGQGGLWAVGDVTGVAAFTHVAKYQGRAVSANILHTVTGTGEPRALDYRAVPRVVFSDPEVAAVGLTEAAAKAAGIAVKTATAELTAITRPYTYEKEPRGVLRLIVDARSGVVLGAWAVGPLASEWIHVAVIAVAARLTATFLRDTIYQYPTFTEAYLSAAEQLAG
jgi:pyruvate/2-oxoglutarate dehydrogenase complex dihydrolipoamide dehydrogenase (E3) component